MEADQSTKPLGELLVSCGLITPGQLEVALAAQKSLGMRLGEALIHQGILDEDRLTWALGAQLDFSYVDLQPGMLDWEYLMGFPLDRLREHRLVPLGRVDGMAMAVTCDPKAPDLAGAIASLFYGDPVTLQLSTREAIDEILDEADRLQASRSGTQVSFSGSDDAEVLAAMDAGLLVRALAIRTTFDNWRHLYTWTADGMQCRSITGRERERLTALFESEFTEEIPLPGGYLGLRRARRDEGRRAARAIGLMGVDGWLIGFERLAGGWPGGKPAPAHVLHGSSPIGAKIALLAVLLEWTNSLRGNQQPVPIFSIEARVDHMVPGVFQCELAEGERRTALARHLHALARPPFLLVEAESSDDICRASTAPVSPGAGPLIILVRPALRTLSGWNIPEDVSIECLDGLEGAGYKELVERLVERTPR